MRAPCAANPMASRFPIPRPAPVISTPLFLTLLKLYPLHCITLPGNGRATGGSVTGYRKDGTRVNTRSIDILKIDSPEENPTQ